jgi:nucleoside-diphosphate-sugar epimerase
MEKKKALLTGTTGFIGHHLARKLRQHGFQVTGIIRPTSKRAEVNGFPNNEDTTLLQVDLSDRTAIRGQLAKNTWDYIFHLGAVRGGRNVSRKEYFRVNVDATEEIGEFASKTGAKLVFCSSVGVYGAIPQILPAQVNSPFQDDNYYHHTKIEAEMRLQGLVSRGLNCVILRPAITYGEGDYGFPYSLVKLIDHQIFFLPPIPVKIHLADVDMLCDAFVAAAEKTLTPGLVYNVADLEPVELKSLVDFISLQLKDKTYPVWKRLPILVFRMGEMMAAALKNELWKARFELISRSWHYDVRSVDEDLGVVQPSTIPTFKKVITWYRSLQG